jgi:membrane fusion protein, copper/silver efflux system
MKRIQLAGLLIAAGIALAAASFYLGRSTHAGPMEATANGAHAANGAEAAPSTDGRKVLYWHDPMVPGQRFDKPGKSPFMDMPLKPVYAGDDPNASGVTVSPTVQQNLGIRYAAVRRADMSSSFDAVGAVQFDERLNVAVQTRVAGYVERLSVRAPMERVRKGQALATIYAPDWLGPQNELLALERTGVSPDLIEAARARMRAMSIPDALVRESEARGTAQARYVLSAPVGGVIAELGVREGVAVTQGTTLFRIAGLEKVWAVVEIPEAQAIGLIPGQKVQASLQADAAQTFEGELKEILPEVSAGTRTLKARFEVDNKAGKLTPGMLLRVAVSGPKRPRLVVASEAVIRTGKRALVIVRDQNGAFEPRTVALGQDFGDDIEVTDGLKEGEQVVASGQFLIDSEASLRSVLGRMTASAAGAGSAASSAAASTATVHHGLGTVENVTADSITISHGPVASLNWPAMTMSFAKPAPKSFADIKPGDRVRFEFKEHGSGYELQSVQHAASGAKQ